MANIYEELNKVKFWKKREYFLWKHKLNMYADDDSEDYILNKLNYKTWGAMKKWEKSAEYLHLVNVLIESTTAKDLEDIHAIVRKKALTGDEKAIRLLMDLQKQARQFNKDAVLAVQTNNKTSNNNDDDDLYDDLEV